MSLMCALPRSGRGEAGARRAAAARSTELLRLGFVMALAMTLHNLPEGFAVCPAAAPACPRCAAHVWFIVISHQLTTSKTDCHENVDFLVILG